MPNIGGCNIDAAGNDYQSYIWTIRKDEQLYETVNNVLIAKMLLYNVANVSIY